MELLASLQKYILLTRWQDDEIWNTNLMFDSVENVIARLLSIFESFPCTP